jgi:HAD superfamily hydrolase (TIGR01509 family)
MSSRPQLILDLGGVLVTNLSPLFWHQLAQHSNTPYDVMVSQYKTDVRDNLWSGGITEEDFWKWLCDTFTSVDGKIAREMLRANLIPLPALDRLAHWSQAADIHILSNHRAEWVAPALAKIEPFIKSATISSNIGFCKPDPGIYDAAAAHLGTNNQILFVDDQEKNLVYASRLGWQTLLADENGNWIEKVNQLLHEG